MFRIPFYGTHSEKAIKSLQCLSLLYAFGIPAPADGLVEASGVCNALCPPPP